DQEWQRIHVGPCGKGFAAAGQKQCETVIAALSVVSENECEDHWRFVRVCDDNSLSHGWEKAHVLTWRWAKNIQRELICPRCQSRNYKPAVLIDLGIAVCEVKLVAYRCSDS